MHTKKLSLRLAFNASSAKLSRRVHVPSSATLSPYQKQQPKQDEAGKVQDSLQSLNQAPNPAPAYLPDVEDVYSISEEIETLSTQLKRLEETSGITVRSKHLKETAIDDIIDPRTGETIWHKEQEWESRKEFLEQTAQMEEKLIGLQKIVHPSFQAAIIPNRGEVGHTLVKELKALGIKSYVFSTPSDLNHPSRKYADDYIPISDYMNSEEILDAITKIKSTDPRNFVVHPGIGFFAESATFARACHDLHTPFVGPSSKVLDLMGSKAASKKLIEEIWNESTAAEKAKMGGTIPIVPGYHGNEQSYEFLRDEVNRNIGYPVMVKAVMGGGGRGISVVHNDAELKTKLPEIQQLASKLFHDSRVLIEKYIPLASHKECQVISDGEDIRILGFRRCDLQFKYQKMIEEAPVRKINDQDEDGEKMKQLRFFCEKLATKLLSHGLKSAITIEFFVDTETGQYYFGEVNPRLQIEHHVTQAVTGFSIPRLQLEIAQGKSLNDLLPETIEEHGYAIECRIYCMNTEKMMPNGYFEPASGVIENLSQNSHETLWLDDQKQSSLTTVWGVEPGNKVNIDVDPMIGKAIFWNSSNDRQKCIDVATEFLINRDVVRVGGVHTNLPLLKNILKHPRYLADPNTSDLNHIIADYLKHM